MDLNNCINWIILKLSSFKSNNYTKYIESVLLQIFIYTSKYIYFNKLLCQKHTNHPILKN